MLAFKSANATIKGMQTIDSLTAARHCHFPNASTNKKVSLNIVFLTAFFDNRTRAKMVKCINCR